MARGRTRWSAEEETALRNGVTKYGVGKWHVILRDPQFSTALKARTNVSLKDKWRNMNLRKGKGRNSCKPVQENFKKTSRHSSKSAALTTAQTEAPTKSLEDGVPDKPTVMHQQSPQTMKVYTRRHKMHQQSPQTIKVYTRRHKRGNTAIAKLY